MAGPYDEAFYEHQREDSLRSGLAVLPLVLDLFEVRSLVDFGCGAGTWLAAARRLGVERTVGLEGPWVTADTLVDPGIDLRTRNLERPGAGPDERFDLAMSLEVAEHLDATRADSFVAEICACSPRVLFSAAVPGQGGAHHVNEQWPDYWASRFAAHGYRPLDVVRPRLWDDDSLPIHYRQNVFLYVHESEFDAVAAKAGLSDRPLVFPMGAVHPELFTHRTASLALEPNLRRRVSIALGIPGAFLRALGRRLSP
jgi:SAM-dependent methyltransferase